MNANDLFASMIADVSGGVLTQVSDPKSPQMQEVREAQFCSYEADIVANLVTARKVDETWARANVLHFFSDTEDGEMLPRLNRLADKYLTCGKFIGAYGAIGMQQLRSCIEKLKRDWRTRRAAVTFADRDMHEKENANIPPCPLCMHFLAQDRTLSAAVYQRSLNAWSVMPYDLVLFTNILLYVAIKTGLVPGMLIWHIGSLHIPTNCGGRLTEAAEPASLIVSAADLDNARSCLEAM